MSVNIVLVGSISSHSKMLELQQKLGAKGAVVTMPDDDGSIQPDVVRGYNVAALDRAKAADVMLVVNEKKHDIEGYVGPNSLMEIGMAFALSKPVYLLHEPSPEFSAYSELKALADGVVGGRDIEVWLKEVLK